MRKISSYTEEDAPKPIVASSGSTVSRFVNAVGGGERAILSWYSYANCLGVDPELFFQKGAHQPRMPKKYAGGVS